jgi:hypothetical protein
LLVWTALRSALQQGDLARWRLALQEFENGYLQPLWQALRSGKISQLNVEVLTGETLCQTRLARGDTWAVWRRSKPLSNYSIV